MANKSIIIIGAGLSGLSAGCYCQMNGFSTKIFEHHKKAGGVCTAWKRDSYVIDGCIHWLMGHKPPSSLHKFYSELGATQGNSFFDIDNFMEFIDEKSGKGVEVTRDLDKLGNDLKSISPADSKK